MIGDREGPRNMRIQANAELDVISRGVARLRTQRELMRVIGGRVEKLELGGGMHAKGSGGTGGVIGDGRGMSILPPRFNPGVSLSEV